MVRYISNDVFILEIYKIKYFLICLYKLKMTIKIKRREYMFLLTLNHILMFISFLNKANTKSGISKSRNSSPQSPIVSFLLIIIILK